MWDDLMPEGSNLEEPDLSRWPSNLFPLLPALLSTPSGTSSSVAKRKVKNPTVTGGIGEIIRNVHLLAETSEENLARRFRRRKIEDRLRENGSRSESSGIGCSSGMEEDVIVLLEHRGKRSKMRSRGENDVQDRCQCLSIWLFHKHWRLHGNKENR